MGNIAVELRLVGGDNVVTIDPETSRINTAHPLQTGDQLVLRVVTGDAPALGFTTNQSKAVFPLRRNGQGDHTFFQRRLAPIIGGPQKFFYPDNRVSVAIIEGADIILHHFAVVNHGDQLYLATNVRHESLVRRADGSVIAPGMPWDELFVHIGTLIDPQRVPTTLPAPTTQNLSGLDEYSALVIWYDPTWSRGVGTLATGETVLIFKNELVSPGVQLPRLDAGDVVSFGWKDDLRYSSESFTHQLCQVALRQPAHVG